MKAVFIGSGNLATQLSIALQKAGVTICQVYSRTAANAEALGWKLGTTWVSDIQKITSDADYYFFSIKDDALSTIAEQMQPNNGIWIHTAGSIPLDIFKNHVDHYGVFYPLQTFSKNRTVNFKQIPCFIEAATPKDEEKIKKIASLISEKVQTLSSEKRKYLHLSAVFACNFTNHMYLLASKILENQNISPETLFPLIDETAAKIHSMPPNQAQTGPAVRYDLNVIEKHMALLQKPTWKELYELISKNIHQETKQ